MKKLFWIVLVSLCLLFSSQPAYAANWIWITSSDENDWYVDVDSVEYLQPDIKSAWVKICRVNGAYKLHFAAFDCSAKKMSIMAAVEYDKNGDVIDSNEYEDWNEHWIHVIPETLGKTIYKYIFDCTLQ